MSKTNILIVEDESIVAKDIQHSLKKLGYNVVDVVSTGENAITAATEKKPDLVLMDINLGDDTTTGVDILQKMKQDGRHDQTKTFAVTGYVMEGDREKYINLGFDEHFPKPLAKETLMEAIEKFFH